MPFNLILLVEVGLKEIAAAFGILVVITAAVVVVWATVLRETPKVRADALKELSDAFNALKASYELLEKSMTVLTTEHERCQRKINEITAFNLRLQSREFGYQNRINRLERAMNLGMTDFNDFTTPEDSTA